MPRASEPTYRLHLPGSTRYCADEVAVTELLRQYMAARPDDPLLERVKIYKYADESDSARPLRVDRFAPKPAEAPTAPASIPPTRRRVGPAPGLTPPNQEPPPRARTNRGPFAFKTTR